MRRKTLMVLGVVVGIFFVLAVFQPALAAERVVLLKIPACG